MSDESNRDLPWTDPRKLKRIVPPIIALALLLTLVASYLELISPTTWLFISVFGVIFLTYVDAVLSDKAKEQDRKEQFEGHERPAWVGPADKFLSESILANRTSFIYLILGAAITVVAIAATGLLDFMTDSTPETSSPTSTTDAVFRLAIVSAAFYLSGQLFRRSGRLMNQAIDFQRAAIAMEVTGPLSDLIEGAADVADDIALMRADFRRSVYEYHLKGGGSSEQLDTSDGFLKTVEELNKWRGRS